MLIAVFIFTFVTHMLKPLNEPYGAHRSARDRGRLEVPVKQDIKYEKTPLSFAENGVIFCGGYW